MVVQSREEFGKERGSNLLGTEKRLEEDTYVTLPLKRGGSAAYNGKWKSREKWSGKRKSFQNQQQPAAEIGALPVENSIIIFCFLKYYISIKIQLSILLFSRQNMHYLTMISELVVCRLSLIANKQEFVKKKIFCCFNFGNSEIRQKLDEKIEIEEKITEIRKC